MWRKLMLVVCVWAATGVLFAQDKPTDGHMTASDGVKVHYLVQGQGTPIILIHGYTGSAQGNWFSNGVAAALARNHKVVAIDCRGHGHSDKPHEPEKYGARMWKDVLELMDHLKIQKAHVHGYSMGGMITTSLLANAPERFITAAYGGSGVQEVDSEWIAKVPKDAEGPDPLEVKASAELKASPTRDEKALAAVRQGFSQLGARSQIDLTKVKIPVLAINGEFDRPNAKTHRMKRELANFKSIVLPGKSHLTAIMPGYIPKQYIDTLVEFINANDSK